MVDVRKVCEGATIIFTFAGGLAAYEGYDREGLILTFLAAGSALMSFFAVGESLLGLPSLRKG